MPLLTLTLNTEGTTSDTQLDALALATEQSEYEEYYSNDSDYFAESIYNAFQEIDHESALLDTLNAYGQQTMDDKTRDAIANLDISDLLTEYEKAESPLLFGAWLALQKADEFSNILNTWELARKDELYECLGDYSHMPEPYTTKLTKVYESQEEDMYHEYLNGDRSDHGVLAEAVKSLFGTYSGASFDYTPKTDTLTLDIEDETLKDWLTERNGELSNTLDQWMRDNVESWDIDYSPYKETEPIPPLDLVASEICDELNYLKQKNIAKRREENARRSEARQRTLAYRKEQADKAEAERRAKLESIIH